MVRRLVGYQRFASQAAFQQLQAVYSAARLWVNFFQPMSKLVSKERVGAKVRKRYDQPQTPYQRLLAAGVLTDEQRQSLEQLYQGLNPLQIRARLHTALERLWQLAERPPDRVAGRPGGPSSATPTDATSPCPGAAETPSEAAVG